MVTDMEIIDMGTDMDMDTERRIILQKMMLNCKISTWIKIMSHNYIKEKRRLERG